MPVPRRDGKRSKRSNRYEPDLVTPPDAFSVGDREPNWLEVELGRQLTARGRRGKWHGRVPLGEGMELRVRSGKRAAVQQLAPDSFLVNAVDSDAITEGDVEIGILPAIMAISALRNLLPERFLAKLRLKKAGVPEDKDLDADAEAADVAGFGCQCRRCACGG